MAAVTNQANAIGAQPASSFTQLIIFARCTHYDVPVLTWHAAFSLPPAGHKLV